MRFSRPLRVIFILVFSAISYTFPLILITINVRVSNENYCCCDVQMKKK